MSLLEAHTAIYLGRMQARDHQQQKEVFCKLLLYPFDLFRNTSSECDTTSWYHASSYHAPTGAEQITRSCKACYCASLTGFSK